MPDLLTARQLADYLQLSARTIYRLLERGGLPAVKVGGQWRFPKTAIDQWIELRASKLAPDDLRALGSDAAGPDLQISSLIAEPNALIVVPADNRDAVIRNFVSQVRLPEIVDLDVLIERIILREDLCSTAVPEGIAFLHTPRSMPRVLIQHDLVAFGRIARPVSFGALDGSRTDLLALLLARDERSHLALLAKTARLCREPDVVKGLRTGAGAAAILDVIRGAEQRVFVDG
jgi:PTS system nitrogen regulatory IIA component